MGFRLDIKTIKEPNWLESSEYTIEDLYYGTKLIGYYDEEDLCSVTYLKSKGKRYPLEAYDDITIVLDDEDFSEFIEYYNNDLKRLCNYDLLDSEEGLNIKKALEDLRVIGFILMWC